MAEIQEAIEKLAPEERAALREWLDKSDPDTMAEEYRNAVHFYGKAAERFFDAVESTIERIRNAPTQFREVEPGVRVCRVPNFPYAIYYIIESSEIIIVAVKHDRRDTDYWSHRIP